METAEKNRKIKEFVIAEVLFGALLFLRYYEAWVHRINGTMMAFSYKYGFISRGLIGTIYQGLDKILPVNMMTYQACVGYTLIITLLFYATMLGLFVLCLKRAKAEYLDVMRYLMLFLTIFTVPMFASHYNFGRLDIYCVFLSLLGAMLLIQGKAEWLLIPISALGVMVHQGYVFMFFNIILVLLMYKILSTEGKERKKYITIFALSLLVACILFFWFELFSHANGNGIYEEIVANAKKLCKNGKIHQDVVDKEILGIDLTGREVKYHRMNAVQFPIFILLMLPYILLMVRFFKGLIAQAIEKKDKIKYIFVAIGAGTILPDLLLKVDFGRWMYAIIVYYCVVLLALFAMGDEAVGRQFVLAVERIKKHGFAALVMLLYPLIFQPLWDVAICSVVAKLAGYINTGLGLGWW